MLGCEVIKLEEESKLNMKKILSEAVTISLIIIICTIVIGAIVIIISPNIEFTQGSSINKNKGSDGEIALYMEKIREALVEVYSEYIDEIDYGTLAEGAISGIAEATGDPYTRFLSDEDFNKMLVEGKEEYVGIGVHLTYDYKNDAILILGLMPDSPAMEAGIKAGDIIYYVDNMRATYKNFYDAIDIIKGEENTKVKLIVKRGEEALTFEIERKKIKENNISSEILDGNIGYIKIWGFENETYKQFKEQYQELVAKNIKGLVIDLRNNPGGFVDQALLIANLFVPESEALKLVSRYGTEQVFKTTSTTEIHMPLTVLVNGNSASSAEILSSIIKDSNKGAIIGTKTYGKGIVQTTKKLKYGGALSITTAKYYTSSGVEIHKNGVEPTILVEQAEEYKNEVVVPHDKDTQLLKAVEYIEQNKK